MHRLIVTHENDTRYFALRPGTHQIGSGSENDLVVPFPGVSRRHAKVEALSDGEIHLVDLDSKNGLRIGGERQTIVTLVPGLEVEIGRARLTLDEVSTSELELGLAIESPATAIPVGHEVEGTGTLRSEEAKSDTVRALRLVREIEHLAPEERRRHLVSILEKSLELVSARALLVANIHASELSLIAFGGKLPGEGVWRQLEALADEPQGRQTVTTVLDAQDRKLGVFLPPATHAPRLIALFPSERAALSAWRQDFLVYLSRRLDAAGPPVSGPPSEPVRNNGELRLPEEMILGNSAAMRGLLEHLRATVGSDLDILLIGETGTGKELLARAVHDSGPNSDGPFVAINCAAIPADLLEAELFGVTARAATGVDPRPGLFVQADGGTIFLDEITEMPDRLQAKLLRVVQEREVLPIGAKAARKISLRIVSASNVALTSLVEKGRLRADLYYRLRGLQFHLPPLRERREDIPALLLALADRSASKYGKRIRGVSRKALRLLTTYPWPGNIRELKMDVERAVLLCSDGGILQSEHFGNVVWWHEHGSKGEPPFVRFGSGALNADPASTTSSSSPTGADNSPDSSIPKEPTPLSPLQDQLDFVERRAILAALEKTHGNKTQAAKLLGVTRNGLALKMKRLGI